MKTHVLDDDLKGEKATNGENKSTIPAVKSIDSVVFDSFKGLTSAVEEDRVKSGLQLLQHLAQSQNIDKREKEVSYVLKRLVRGVGASTTISRAGFFTTLVGFLEAVPDEELAVKMVLDVAAKQLHVGKTISNKEDADAIVGQILTCGALIRSQKISRGSQKEIQKVCQTLIDSSKHRTYHHALAYSFCVELLDKLSEDQFAEIVWPLISLDLTLSWEKQSIHSLHCLITATTKFPKTLTSKYIKTTFGGPSLLNARSANQLYKLFWENTSASTITHPAFECFGTYIANSKYLESFWMTEVDGSLKSPSKLREIGTLKILSDILASADPASLKVSTFLTENFMTMMCESLKKIKFKKEETLKAFYSAFLEALFKWSAKLTDDSEKVAIIKKLIFHPGNVNIEKLTSERIVHQIISNLGEEGVKEIFEIYKNIFLANVDKNVDRSESSWMNAERQCAGYMLQHLIGHKNIQTAFEWRKEQLKFFMTVGLFHTNDGEKLVSKKDDNETITADLAGQMKSVFYASLQCKLPRLQEERGILLSLVETCNAIIVKKNSNKYFRSPVDEKILKAWNEMHAEVTKQGDIENKLKLVFNILLLHMGLQLFHEPEMAENAIWDLEKCMAKTSQQSSKKKSKKAKAVVDDSSEEPEWIDVVIDLFLHLLSQNTSTLRNVVNAMFPYLCDSLSLSAVHQILAVLDMQDGNNPLSNKAENENMDDEEEEEKDDPESDQSDENESDDDDKEDTDEDEELVEEEEEENTYTDLLRNAVSQVLIGDLKDDQDSVDLNDMDEEEGKRLDEALSGIFKSLVKPNQYKKTKGYRIETTSNMHFRIRVLDLIEIYIQHKPSLLVTVEIMTSLYNMIEFCTDSELKPLASKVEKVLQKLTALRQFSTVDDISEKNISDYLRIVVEKKVSAPVFDVHNKVKSKCCVFLLSCTKLLSDGNEKSQVPSALQLLQEYLDDFIKSRNPAITTTLLGDVFRMRWSGIWQLATHLAKKGLSESTRTYRRIQVCELLDVIYKNRELIRQDQKVSKKSLKSIETQIQGLAQYLTKAGNVSTREFNVLLNVLFSAHQCHAKTNVSSSFDNKSLCDNIQTIRQKIKEDGGSYARFCKAFGVKVIRNVQVKNQIQANGNGHSTVQQNGDNSMEIDEDDDSEEEVQSDNKRNGKKRAKKSSENAINGTTKRKGAKNETDNRKEKRLRKEGRMRAMSKGLGNEGDD